MQRLKIIFALLSFERAYWVRDSFKQKKANNKPQQRNSSEVLKPKKVLTNLNNLNIKKRKSERVSSIHPGSE